MKWVCVTLLCLSVVGGLINCTPLDFFPEKVLMKPKQSEGSISDVPGEILEKIGKMVLEMIPGSKDGQATEIAEDLKGHLGKMKLLKDSPVPVGDFKSISSKIPLADGLSTDHLDLFLGASKKPVASAPQKRPKKDEEPSKADLNTEDTEAKSRKRRTATAPATKVVGKPEVESRYKIDNTVYPATPGGFVQGNDDFEVTDLDHLNGFKDSGRPVIIYIRKLYKLGLQSKASEENCDD